MAEESFLILSCTCGQRMKIPVDAMGKTFKCVRCAQHVTATDQTVQGKKPAAPVGPPSATEEPIGQQLMNAGLISEEQLHEALSLQRTEGGKTLENLIKLGHLDKDALHDYLSRQPGIATIELSRFNIESGLLELLPKELAQQNLVLPIDRLGKLLTVAMACPLDRGTIGEVERITGLRVKAMLCRLDDLNDAVRKYYGDGEKSEKVELTASHFGLKTSPKVAEEDVREPIAFLEAMAISNEAAAQLKRELAGSNPSNVILASIIRQDPVLSAMILRTSNSVVYGMAGKVENTALAYTLIGQDGLSRLLTEWSTVEDEGLRELLRQRANLRSKIAQELARMNGSVGPNLAATAASIADLGRFVLFAVAPKRYLDVDPELRGEDLMQRERELFTMSHNEAGAQLAASWHLPASLYEAMKYYPKPQDAENWGGLAELVCAADRLAWEAHSPSAETLEMLAGLGMERSRLDKMLQDVL